MFSRFGAEVVVIEREMQPLPRRSRAGDGALCAAYRRRYPAGIWRRDALRRLRRRARQMYPHPRRGGKEEDLVADQLLVAVGRRPALDALILRRPVSKLRRKAFRPMRPCARMCRTSGPPVTLPAGINSRMSHPIKAAWSHTTCLPRSRRRSTTAVIPWVTFTDPELARVGASEADLQEAKIEYRVGACNSANSTAPSRPIRLSAA